MVHVVNQLFKMFILNRIKNASNIASHSVQLIAHEEIIANLIPKTVQDLQNEIDVYLVAFGVNLPKKADFILGLYL